MSKEFRIVNLRLHSCLRLALLFTASVGAAAHADSTSQTFGQPLTNSANSQSRMENGDRFLMPEAEAISPNAESVQTPARGITKARVLQQFGEPNRRDDAVGDPPISAWHYSDFSVFFEYNLALHSVIAARPMSPRRPAANK